MAVESGARVGDCPPIVELVECQPEPDAPATPLPTLVPPEASPVQQALEATIEQTGADPPPRADR
jgi:hypothetical protein